MLMIKNWNRRIWIRYQWCLTKSKENLSSHRVNLLKSSHIQEPPKSSLMKPTLQEVSWSRGLDRTCSILQPKKSFFLLAPSVHRRDKIQWKQNPVMKKYSTCYVGSWNESLNKFPDTDAIWNWAWEWIEEAGNQAGAWTSCGEEPTGPLPGPSGGCAWKACG